MRMLKITVPASSANLGAGFDALGLALTLYNRVWMEEADGCHIESADGVPIPTDETNLIYHTARVLYRRCGRPFRGLHIRQENNIPMARGLGSSSACIAGGLLGANELLGRPCELAQLVDLAAAMEGHPDNSTPALLGGFVVKMFWCKYICPLGAVSNIFKFTLLFVIAALGGWALGALGVANAWVWTIGGACLAAYIVEIAKMRSCTFPLMYIRRDLNTCNNCGLCEKKCPYQLPIHDYVKVKHVDCTLCGNCIGACAKDALQVNGRRSLRWVPGLLAVVLFFLAIWLGSTMELPTIDEKWGDYEKVENLQTFEMEGLQTIKCFGSSKAFSAKMQAVQGVYGVKTFVRRHGVEVLYDPAATDTLKIQAAIFAPTLRKYAMPGEQVPVLDVVKLGVEGLHDRMDMIYFGMVLQKIEGVYGFTSEFACPVDVTVYVDPAAGITEKMFGEAIDAKELIIPAKEGEKVIPMHTVLKEYATAGQVSRDEFAQVMFRDIEKLNGRFLDNQEKWGDDEQFPKAVYEMELPSIEKPLVRRSFPYFKSFLSCTDGIVSLDFVLRDTKPVMRIHYVKSMWDDARIWKEIFQAERWTLRMSDGTFKESEPRLKFSAEGRTAQEDE